MQSGDRFAQFARRIGEGVVGVDPHTQKVAAVGQNIDQHTRQFATRDVNIVWPMQAKGMANDRWTNRVDEAHGRRQRNLRKRATRKPKSGRIKQQAKRQAAFAGPPEVRAAAAARGLPIGDDQERSLYNQVGGARTRTLLCRAKLVMMLDGIDPGGGSQL
jgi:hypothetical protein